MKFALPLTVAHFLSRAGKGRSNPCTFDAFVEFEKYCRVGAGDGIADKRVIAAPGVPINLSVSWQDCFGKTRHDLRLRKEMLARRLNNPMRGVKATRRIFNRDKLHTRCLTVDLDAAETW
jgi:hypothetical protein